MRKLLASIIAIAALMGLATPAQAFSGGSFLVTCQFTKYGDFDPLTHEMSHNHTFSGGTNVSQSSTKASLLQGGSNCSTSKDHTAYWIPTFTKNGMKLSPYQVNVYYVGRGINRVAFTNSGAIKSMDVRYACSNNSSGSKTPINCGGGTAQYNVTFFSSKFPEVHMMFKFNTSSLIGAKASSDGMMPRHGDMLPAWESGVLEGLIKNCLNAHKTCGRIKG